MIWILLIFLFIVVFIFLCASDDSKETFATNMSSYYTISWTAPVYQGALTYNISIMDNNGNYWGQLGVTDTYYQFGANTTDTNWNTVYNISIVAVNATGQQSAAATSTFTSGPGPVNSSNVVTSPNLFYFAGDGTLNPPVNGNSAVFGLYYPCVSLLTDQSTNSPVNLNITGFGLTSWVSGSTQYQFSVNQGPNAPTNFGSPCSPNSSGWPTCTQNCSTGTGLNRCPSGTQNSIGCEIANLNVVNQQDNNGLTTPATVSQGDVLTFYAILDDGYQPWQQTITYTVPTVSPTTPQPVTIISPPVYVES
jgi:hypothetical protein